MFTAVCSSPSYSSVYRRPAEEVLDVWRRQTDIALSLAHPRYFALRLSYPLPRPFRRPPRRHRVDRRAVVDNLRRVKKSSSSTLCPLLENIKLLNFYRKFHCFRLDLRERLFRKESSSCGRIGLACPGKIIIEIRKNTLMNTFIEIFHSYSNRIKEAAR